MKKKAGLFATCLVNTMRPRTGFASIHLLEKAGFDVVVPSRQTCCGQPNYNSGDLESTRRFAQSMAELYSDCDYVVVPSGSCAGMVRIHYPKLFEPEDPAGEPVRALAEKTYELVSFLTGIAGMEQTGCAWDTSVTYHDSCSGLRELNIKTQPRQLLNSINGITLKEMESPEVCCGFGGLFCVKYPEVSGEMTRKKVVEIEETGAACVAMGDVGCLLNIEGMLHRRGSAVKAFHVAEILAGMTAREKKT